ncbi:MAG: hypothetical protein DRQ56_04985 [Gammaproteobacteria bacterium]|nr:MAG: hypothetical protein DRQ56_04985 [Gammaproteobacteria bacterium]
MRKNIPGFVLITLLVVCGSASAGLWPFEEDNVIEAVFDDKELEQGLFKKLFSEPVIRKESDVKVLSMGDTILIAGVAKSTELRNEIEKVVLAVVDVKREAGDAVLAKPANSQACEKKKQHLFNERRKFNLRNKAKCSAVRRVFNRVVISQPGDYLSRGEDAVLTAQVELALMKQNALTQEGVPLLKVASIGGVVYVLGNKNRNNEKQVVEWVEAVDGVSHVEMVY